MNVPRRHQSGVEKEEKVTAWSFREPPAVTPFLKRKKGDSPKLETQTHPTLSKPNTGARRTLFKRKKEIKAPLLNSTHRTLCLGIRHGLFPPPEAKAPSLEPFIGGHLVYSPTPPRWMPMACSDWSDKCFSGKFLIRGGDRWIPTERGKSCWNLCTGRPSEHPCPVQLKSIGGLGEATAEQRKVQNWTNKALRWLEHLITSPVSEIINVNTAYPDLVMTGCHNVDAPN